jgi:hypothetical protein
LRRELPAGRLAPGQALAKAFRPAR